jgi:hypothetical protein
MESFMAASEKLKSESRTAYLRVLAIDSSMESSARYFHSSQLP